MRWHFSVVGVEQADFDEALENAVVRARLPASAKPPAEQRAQVSAAMGAARLLVQSGAAGRGLLSATISGYANPVNTTMRRYPPDGIAVTVMCADPDPDDPIEE